MRAVVLVVVVVLLAVADREKRERTRAQEPQGVLRAERRGGARQGKKERHLGQHMTGH